MTNPTDVSDAFVDECWGAYSGCPGGAQDGMKAAIRHALANHPQAPGRLPDAEACARVYRDINLKAKAPNFLWAFDTMTRYAQDRETAAMARFLATIKAEPAKAPRSDADQAALTHLRVSNQQNRTEADVHLARIAELEADVKGLKCNEAGLQTEIAELRAELAHTQSNADNLGVEVATMRPVAEVARSLQGRMKWFPSGGGLFGSFAKAVVAYEATLAHPDPMAAGFAAVREHRNGAPMDDGMTETLRVMAEAVLAAERKGRKDG